VTDSKDEQELADYETQASDMHKGKDGDGEEEMGVWDLDEHETEVSEDCEEELDVELETDSTALEQDAEPNRSKIESIEELDEEDQQGSGCAESS
jgi:hypothetical protein